MENLPATLQSNLSEVKDPTDYLTATNIRRWELSVNWKSKFYLTDEEKDYFLSQLRLGKKIIAVGEMILTPRFDYLVPIKQKLMKPDKAAWDAYNLSDDKDKYIIYLEKKGYDTSCFKPSTNPTKGIGDIIGSQS